MNNLTASQVAARVGKTSYTLKRWYDWYENLSDEALQHYIERGMPELPKYEVVGSTKWRYWKEDDIEQIIKFSAWVPHTKKGVFKKRKT